MSSRKKYKYRPGLKSYWRYGIVKDDFPSSFIDRFSIRELYYDKNGNLESWSKEPEELVGESKEDLIALLELMLKDAKKYGITKTPK